MKRGSLAGLATLAVLASACSPLGEKSSPSACVSQDGEKPAKVVLRCTEKSIAFVETESGSGTGVVVNLDKKKYVLTNEHVVDPFNSADVNINERSFEDLPVVGIDAASDIALLGPVVDKDLPPALAIADGTGVERGDELFLVGFPGETKADDLEATIASGIVARVRTVKEFDQTYVQTDASIGSGQSGGPMFDSDANLVGISGLSFAEEFALALTGKDVKKAMQRIIEGKGDEYIGLSPVAKEGVGAKSGVLKLFDASDGQVLFLPAAKGERTWNFMVGMSAKPIVSVEKLKGGEPLAVSASALVVQTELAKQVAAARGGRPEDLPDFAAGGLDPKLAPRETAPGKFSIPIKEDESALAFVVAPLTDAPVEVPWESDIPLIVASRQVSEVVIELGGQVDKVIGGFDTAVDVLVNLTEGQRVQLYARSPQGDADVTVFEPGRKLDHLTMADPEAAGAESFTDTEDGLYGLDSKTHYDVKKTGQYRFRLSIGDVNTVRVRFTVLDCAKIDCEEKKG